MNNEQNQNNQNIESLNPNTPPVMGPPDVVSQSPNVQPMGNMTPPVTPIPPVENINLQPEGVVPQVPVNEPTNQSVVEPLMSTPLTPDMNMNTMAPPVQNQDFAQPQNTNFTQPQSQNLGQPAPMTNNMGMNQNMMPNNQIDLMGGVPTPPPLPPEGTGKKGPKKGINNKVLLIVLIVVLIAGVGYGIYYFLVASKAKTSNILITPTRAEVELGTKLENKASNFATVSGYDINNCTVETDLDTSKYGTYQYKVTCGSQTTSPQTVMVRDTTAPVAIQKDVIVLPNTPVTEDDFFEDIQDASEYTLEFESEPDTSTPGTYEVNITISDEYENTITVKGNLIVDENAPATYLLCSVEDDGEDPVIAYDYRFGISPNGNRYDSHRIVKLTYKTEESYNAAVEEYEESESIKNIKGAATFNDKTFTITLKAPMSEDELKKEFESDNAPATEDEIQTIFDNQCELSFN